MKSIVREIGGASLIVVLAASILLGENPPIVNAVSQVSCGVTDETGAVIPKAEVVFESGTREVRTQTDASGAANVELESGTYVVTANARGFAETLVPEFLVQAPGPTVLKLTLRVGNECDDCGGGLPNGELVEIELAQLPEMLLQPRLTSVELARMKAFAGVWKTRTSTVTHKANITLNLALDAESQLGGTVRFVNPNRSQTTVRIVFTTFANNVLAFQTDDGFSWQLVLTKNSRVAALKGSAHELLIEERVAKQR